MGSLSNSKTNLALGLSKAKLLCPAFLFSINFLSAQIYNYDPIRHNNFEANPAYLANEKPRVNSKFSADVIHVGNSFASNKFYSEGARFSLFSPYYFVGLGLTLNHTHLNDSINYTNVGLGGAYRVILFDKVYTKIGFIYKLMSLYSVPGTFNYYTFSSVGEGPLKNRAVSNANFSAAFSSSGDKYYVSGGVLNYNSPFTSSASGFFFPEYYFVNAGNFGKMLGLMNWDVSYTFVAKKFKAQTGVPVSHYASFVYNGFRITRQSSVSAGVRAGWEDNEFIHFNPMLAFYKRRTKRTSKHSRKAPSKYIIYKLMADVGYDPKANAMPFKPNLQFNLTYQF